MLTFPIWCNNKDWIPKCFHGTGIIEVWLLHLNNFDSTPQSFTNILQGIQLNNYRFIRIVANKNLQLIFYILFLKLMVK